MTDRYERIRKALEMGPTPGPRRAVEQSVIGPQDLSILFAKVTFSVGINGSHSVPIEEAIANAALAAACDPDTIQALLDECDALRAEVSELRAARIAYASEFPEAKDGGPDTGNIHTNIRSLKARAERLAEALQGWWEAHRPVGWTEDQHRSCPHVNLATDAEKALATALLRDQEEWK